MKRILEYIIDKGYDGRSIRDYLTVEHNMSGTLLKQLKRTENGITVNGEMKFVTYVLHTDDVVRLEINENISENIVPTKLDFTIVYEDMDVIIVDKPPHMPTHPSQGNFTNTLANALMYYWKNKGEEHVFRAVNRLDKDTSGLMCVAKNSYAHAILCDEIKTKSLKRKYKAIVCGNIDGDGTIDAPIMRESGSVIKRCVNENGQTAITHYKVLEKYDGYTLVGLELETGRTHQIRVHMSYIGCPLLGDWLYGEENHKIFDRQALHSCYIEFTHPVSGKSMIFSSELPQDMNKFIKMKKIHEIPENDIAT